MLIGRYLKNHAVLCVKVTFTQVDPEVYIVDQKK